MVGPEENLSQMIRDYIELGSSRTAISSSPSSDFLDEVDCSEPTSLSLKEILDENVTDAENKILEIVSFCLKKDATETKNLRKRVVKKLGVDYNYEACLCRSCWRITTDFGRRPSSGLGFITGDYEYIDVTIKNKKNGDDDGGQRIIIDVDFRSQFELARPSRSYQELTDSLPSVFVGSEEKLEKMVSLLSWAAEKSLKERGLHVPFWRKSSYMQAKWLSQDCKRIPFSQLFQQDEEPTLLQRTTTHLPK